MELTIRRPLRQELDGLRMLASRMPDAFTPKGREFLARDAATEEALVAETDGRIVGVVVWSHCAAEIEILWLATDPQHRRKGIGTVLVNAVVKAATSQLVVIAKTADPEVLPAGTGLMGETFRSTWAFFRTMGFDLAAQISDYWGRGNRASIFVKRLW